MKTFAPILILLLAGGCAAPVPKAPLPVGFQPHRAVVSAGGASEPQVQPITLHVWLMDGTNATDFPETDDWTNKWSFLGVLATPDLTVPSAQDEFMPAPVEELAGHLGFTVQSTWPQFFIRSVVYQTK